MNRTYKLVWNAAQHMWVVAGELAKGRKKTSGKSLKLGLLLACSVSTLSAYAVPAANALPTGESVASGSATFDRTVSNQLTVNQLSSRLITNWNSFDVGSAATVTFAQPNAASIALNRVTSASPTEIFGQLSANGQLIVVNPNGITFGAGSQVSAAAVVASSLDILDGDFNLDNLLFTRGATTGAVTNAGSIQAKHVVLLSPDISNSGSLSAVDGNVGLINADQANASTLSVSQASTVAGVIKNTGTIQATQVNVGNGLVVLLGDTSQNSSHIDVSGSINAASGSTYIGRNINVVNDLTQVNSLSMAATDAININADVILSGNASLTLTTGAAGYALNYGAKLDLLGATPAFSVNTVPYSVITNVNQLQNMSLNLAGRYVLANNIDASATAGWNLGEGFVPVGNVSLPFNGQLEGLGHAIDALTINRPSAGVGDYTGLIGVTQGATIRHVGLSNASISGGHNTGGLLGYLGNGLALATLLEGNWVTGSVTGLDGVGGLAGGATNSFTSNTRVNKNYVNVMVQGNNQVGGLIGTMSVLGIIGGSPVVTTVNNNYVANSVQGQSNVGGLIGQNIFNELLIGSVSSYTVQDNSVAASVTGTTNTGGLFGSNNISTSNFNSTAFAVRRNYVSGLITGTTVTGGLVGQNVASFGFTAPFQNNFWNTSSTGQIAAIGVNANFPVVTGFTGIDAAQSVQLATFAPWGASIDANAGTGSTWRIYDGLSGPLLRSFLKPLTVTADDVTKTYDGTSFTTASYGYSKPTVDLSKILGTALVGGTALGARNAGNYVIGLSGLYSTDQLGYDIDFAAGDLTINKRLLTLTATDASKVYDGKLTSADKPLITGRQRGDSIVGLTQSYLDKNAGIGKTINVNAGYTIRDGNNGNNYDVVIVNSTAGVITPKAVTISTVANTKVYDGGVTSANKPLVTGLITGDRITGLFQQYETKTVGTGKKLLIKNGYVVQDGNSGGNYSVTEQGSMDGVITAH